MSKKVSVTGWVPKARKESEILNECALTEFVREDINEGLMHVTTKAMFKEMFPDEEGKRVRVTAVFDVEVLP